MMRRNKRAVAIAVAASLNEKIGDAAATYVAQGSCPTSCVFFDGGGCYAESGFLRHTTDRLNEAAGGEWSPEQLAVEEASAIDGLKVRKGWPLRLHVVGDARTGRAALIVARAAERYMGRGGGRAWAYTHSWREVSRAVWGRVSVLASCESASEVREAQARGYAASVVVKRFPSTRMFTLDGVKVVPCPAQTHDDVSCASCGLCLNDGLVRERGYAIGFEVHGTGLTVKKATLALEHPDDPDRKLTSRVLIPRLLEAEPSLTNYALAKRLGLNYGTVKQMREKLEAEAEAVRAAA